MVQILLCCNSYVFVSELVSFFDTLSALMKKQRTEHNRRTKCETLHILRLDQNGAIGRH